MDKRTFIAQTVVRNGDDYFYVTTEDVKSEATGYRYAETKVFEFDVETKVVGKEITRAEAREHSSVGHCKAVQRLSEVGLRLMQSEYRKQ